jgi:hypothetical protein
LALSETAWKHIRERHPELSHYQELVKEVAAEPELILGGKQREKKAIRFVAKTHLGPKYLVVVFREERSRKAIITAYFTSDLKRIKGHMIWKA